MVSQPAHELHGSLCQPFRAFQCAGRLGLVVFFCLFPLALSSLFAPLYLRSVAHSVALFNFMLHQQHEVVCQATICYWATGHFAPTK